MLTDNEKLYKLFKIQCDDILVLAEMEWNGMLYDSEGALAEAKHISTKMEELDNSFRKLFNNGSIDINSTKHVSTVLFGGVITEDVRIVCGVFKSGTKKGQTRFAKEEIQHYYDRIVDPAKGTETKISRKAREEGKTSKETQWSVSKDVLKKLKAKGKAKKAISIILEYKELSKLKSTYLEGWSNLIEEQCWEKDVIHGSLNPCVTKTGRLAASKPNIQTADKSTKKYLVSRYDN